MSSAMVTLPSSEPESMRKLQALREKIQAELEDESRAREEESAREPAIPLSLAPDYATAPPAPVGSPNAAGARRGKGRGAKSTAGASPDPKAKLSEGQMAIQAARDKVASMKLDKWVQRELESELDRQSAETAQLKAQNSRLREIVALRQQCNSRREDSMRSEIDRLSVLCDDACVDAHDMDATMGRLREMNTRIQQGAEQLRAAIEEHAEAERMQLVRSYRVKIREVKQLLHEQKERNREGAQNWIERHSVLERDRNKAAEALQQLEVRNEGLSVQNREMQAMLKHQGEQRSALTTRVAVVKRENKRLEEHIASMESELTVRKTRRGAGQRSPHGSQSPGRDAPRPTTRSASSRATSHTQASHGKLVPNAVVAVEKQRKRAQAMKSSANAQETAEGHKAVLKQLRRALEAIRTQLRQVRSSHVELLQERTELEVFMRQCMEDVRRDMYRFTVVSNAGKTRGNGTERVLPSYSAAERRQLLSILQSKLRVFATLHAHMFPSKADAQIDIEAALRDEAGLTEDDMGALARAVGAGSGDGHRLAALASGGAVHQAEQDRAAEATVDALWSKWRQWTSTNQREL